MSKHKFDYEKIFGMVPKKRRRYLNKEYKPRKGRKRHFRKRERTWSETELIEFLREKNIRSSHVLADNYTEPRVHDYRKMFGSWSEAIAVIFGDEDCAERTTKKIVAVTAEYLARLLVEAGIEKKKDYLRLHKEHPEIYPSFWYVSKHFGGWKGIKRFIKHYYIKQQFDDYIKAVLEEGKHLTLEQCRKRQIYIDIVLYWFGGKRNFNRAVEEMIEQLKQNA